MLIPRYTLRWLLGLTTFSAGVSLILAHAVRGEAWAIGVTAGLWSLVVVGLFYIAAFLVAWLIAQVELILLHSRRARSGVSPFAQGKAGEPAFSLPPASAPQPTVDGPPMTG
jgi:hypothetical protein